MQSQSHHVELSRRCLPVKVSGEGLAQWLTHNGTGQSNHSGLFTDQTKELPHTPAAFGFMLQVKARSSYLTCKNKEFVVQGGHHRPVKSSLMTCPQKGLLKGHFGVSCVVPGHGCGQACC